MNKQVKERHALNAQNAKKGDDDMVERRFLEKGEMIIKDVEGNFHLAWWRGAKTILIGKEEGEKLFAKAKGERP